uniref:Uncharacterized protein n=1 Tax=Panagrellus redivivus TaxID=6233 RepID=A0A7E5A1C6_PANRE
MMLVLIVYAFAIQFYFRYKTLCCNVIVSLRLQLALWTCAILFALAIAIAFFGVYNFQQDLRTYDFKAYEIASRYFDVHRQFTIFGKYIWHDRLKVLNLESLSARRKRFDLKYFHQALVGLTPRNFEINVRKSITRGSSMKVFVPGYKSKYKRSFFSYRAARFFTKLPRSVQSISKHKAFVASLLV